MGIMGRSRRYSIKILVFDQEFRAVISHALGRDGGRRDSDQRGAAPKTPIKCFKCGKEGHHQANCANPPLCYACHNTGHIALNCSLHVQKRGIKLVGFGIPGQGFFSLHVDIPAAESEKIPVRGIMSIIDGFGEVDKIEKELNHMFSDVSWEWKVKQLNEREFLITFPSKMIRRQLSRTKSFDFECYPIKASVVETAMTEEAVDELMAVWVKIFGIPNFVRDEVHVKEIAELVGEFEVLDEKSIKGDGPVRVRVACKDPNELFVSMLIYINKVGYKVRWETEDQKDDDDVDDLGGDDDNESFLFEKTLQDKLRKGAASAPAKTGKSSGQSHSKKVALDDKSCFSPIPMLKLEMDNISGSKESNPLAMVVWEEDEMSICTQEPQEDKMNVNVVTEERMRAEEALDEIDSFEVVSSKRTKKKKGKIPILVKRKSDRNKGQVVPVQKRVEFLAKKKNLDNSGTNRKEIDRNIATIKAKELAQAALAECEWKKSNETKKENFSDRELGLLQGWIISENFKDLVLEKMPIRDNDYILNFWNRKLSSVRKFLKGWGANKNSEWKRAKQELVSKLESFDLEANLHDLCPEQWEERYKIEKELDQVFELEELYWHKRSGEEWLLKGDKNTSYFHKIANGKRRKSLIHSLVEDGRITEDEEDLSSHIVEFYKNLFRADSFSSIHMKENFWSESGIIPENMREEIDKPFEMKELDKVISQAKNNTAPGPDGFSIQFYTFFWDHLKQDLYEMLIMLYHGELDLKRLNYGVITLIPKCNEANSIRQFRLICVSNDCFKIISKVITNKISLIAFEIISHTQTTFIPGRFILEGGIVLHEMLHVLKTKNLSGVIFKIDFEKAYDKVSWEFLFEVLKRKGFSDNWIGWIKSCVTGGKVCVNINGNRSQFFGTSRGLRQGEPLSPLLFNLVGDALARMFELAKSNGILSGLVPNLVNGGLTHLQYTDDTIIFIPCIDSEIMAIKFLLYCFEEISGMKINYHKSEVFSVGISPEEEQRVANMLNCNSGSFPLCYLGLSMSPNRLRADDFSYILQKIRKRLNSWQAGSLYYSGRAILINAYLSSIPSYSMGLYYLPEVIYSQIDSLRSKFYWEGLGDKRRYHMVKWSNIAFPKDFGGLGFTETRAMNTALLSKWIFKLESEDNSLCTNLLRVKYMAVSGFFLEEVVEGRGGKFARRMDSETSTRDKKSQGSKKRIWLKQEI
uniref:CCHC-type domain-containing protein n=1 Tax=Oryza brachyantha TaxID=4533 RepID=J3LGX6_ORYBR